MSTSHTENPLIGSTLHQSLSTFSQESLVHALLTYDHGKGVARLLNKDTLQRPLLDVLGELDQSDESPFLPLFNQVLKSDDAAPEALAHCVRVDSYRYSVLGNPNSTSDTLYARLNICRAHSRRL